MKGMLLVARREMAERRAVLAAALLAGLLAFASPLVPGVVSGRAAEARDAMSLFVAIGFGLLVTLLIGASIVARDLADGRLGFDFAQPLSGWAIGGGRFLAAIVLCLASIALAFVPATLVGGGLLSPVFRQFAPTAAGIIAGSVVALLPLAHLASVALRSRSRWLALDLAGLVVAGGVATLAAQRVEMTASRTSMLILFAGLAGAGIVGLWAASAAQVLAGRADLRRGHRVQALVLAPVLVTAALGGYGFSRWLVAVEPADLVPRIALGAPAGSWALVSGWAPPRPLDYQPAFLVDLQSREHLALGLSLGVAFSGDGRRAAWLRFEGPRDRLPEIVVVDLETRPLQVRSTRIFPQDGYERQIALSEDGQRLALLERERLSAYETDTGRLLATMPASPDLMGKIGFRTSDRVRLYQSGSKWIEISELDLSARSGVPVTRVPGNTLRAWTRGHDRLLASSDESYLLVDGITGQVLAERPRARAARGNARRLLADGRLALLLEADAGTSSSSSRLSVFSRDGQVEQVLELAMHLDGLGGEVAAGQLLAKVTTPGSGYAQDLWLLELDTGALRPLNFKTWPSDYWTESSELPQPGSLASRLISVVRKGEPGVGLYDPASGAIRSLWEDVAR